MLKSLKKIENPALRAITAALTAGAIATMVSGVIIGFTAPKNENAQKIGVFTSLLAAVGGSILGLAIGSQKDPEISTLLVPESEDWKDWRDFIVVRKVKESQEITSFYLQPKDGKAIPNYKPGQFLTIKLDIPGQNRPVIRTYSLSDYSEPCDHYRLSIKREGSPDGVDVPPGIASNFMHDQIESGSVLQAKPPNGKFFLDLSQSSPIILLSNGVGITPMLAMVKAATLKNPQRQIWFLHGTRNSDFHGFQEEISELVRQNPNLHVHYRYSRPKPEEEGLYPSRGYVDIEMIKSLIAPELERLNSLQEAEYFLCGSPAFMDSIKEGLNQWGVEDQRFHSESFGKGSKAPVVVEQMHQAEIVFSRSMKTLTWTEKDGTILEFAEANNVDPPYSCRAGICLTCMCPIQEGEVEYREPPTGEPDQGSVLICISHPKTARVVLDL
jgi:ferredoxin-NADP reductase